jgi:hypothetical protein
MDEATRQRIVDRSDLPAWLSFAAHLTSRTGEAPEGAGIVVDWLEACTPEAAAESVALLRAMEGRSWRVTRAPAASGSPAQFVLQVGASSWGIRLRQNGVWGAGHIQRLHAAERRA